MNQSIHNKKGAGLTLVHKPMHCVTRQEGLRDGSTGRVVFVPAVVPQHAGAKLHRVWAVAETVGAAPPHADEAVVNAIPASTERTPETLGGAPELVAAPKVELAFYRKYTEGLLRRYLRLSMQAGRVPSLLGRELFRGNVTHYTVHGLEDVVIFCHDVEQRLAKLNSSEKELVKRVALQHYTREETAGMIGVSLRTCIRHYDTAMDRLTGLFLEAGLLETKNGGGMKR